MNEGTGRTGASIVMKMNLCTSKNRAYDRAMLLALTHGVKGGAGTDWLDTTDAGLDTFAQNFSSLITASPATYGLDAPTAAALATAFTNYDSALTIANAPPTRTAANIATKDAFKAALITVIRTDAGIVQANPSVSNDDKISLGLPVSTGTPAPIPPPSTFPLLSILDASNLVHNLQYADNTTPTSARKPAGSIGMELYVEVSATEITDPAAISYYGLVTRNPVAISYGSGDKGRQAYIVGRWINATGEPGPWANIVNFTVAG
jgi:hypothetical protein